MLTRLKSEPVWHFLSLVEINLCSTFRAKIQLWNVEFSFLKKISIHLFIYLAVPGLCCDLRGLCCSVWDLLIAHAGSSSLTRDWTWGPCTGSAESQPLDHQGSPEMLNFQCYFSALCLNAHFFTYLLWDVGHIISPLWASVSSLQTWDNINIKSKELLRGWL